MDGVSGFFNSDSFNPKQEHQTLQIPRIRTSFGDSDDFSADEDSIPTNLDHKDVQAELNRLDKPQKRRSQKKKAKRKGQLQEQEIPAIALACISTKAGAKNEQPSYFYPLNTKYRLIVGRENKAKQSIAMLHGVCGGIRPLFIGPAGIGKESIVAKIALIYQESPKYCPWKDTKVWCISCRELIAEFTDDSLVEDVIDALKEMISPFMWEGPRKPLFYFKDIEYLLQLPKVALYLHMLFKKPLLAIGSICGNIVEEKVSEYARSLTSSNFMPMSIDEIPLEDACKIIKHHYSKLPRDNNIEYTDEGFKLAVTLASKHISFRPLPIKAINLVQECTTAQLLEVYASGKRQKIHINAEAIATFMSKKIGIPANDLNENLIFNELECRNKLKEAIVGQDYAINIMVDRIAKWKMNLLDPNKAWGAFLFVGPTGVGKTELAGEIARQLFHNNESLIILDGSEYKESHTTSCLIGAPSGYEGHESGGKLTTPLLQNPYRVVLFDEFEKAHDDVRKLFLQAFDRGCITDRRGKVADCTKALFLMTSNLGSEKQFFAVNTEIGHVELIESLKPILIKKLSPELYGRFTEVVPFMPLTKKDLPRLAEVQLKKIKAYQQQQNTFDLSWTSETIKILAMTEADLHLGGRNFCKQVAARIESALKKLIVANGAPLKGVVTIDKCLEAAER